jgi:hypothetical protein
VCPSARSMAATVEESTPPDIATAMVSFVSIQRSAVSSEKSKRPHRRPLSDLPLLASIIKQVKVLADS